MSPMEQAHRDTFLRALHKDAIDCGRPGCPGPVQVQDLSQLSDRVKTFGLKCERCNWQERIGGREELLPSWDDTTLLDMAYNHLMHQPALCPADGITVVFTSLPNPRRRARYRVSCYYCGRQAEMDWPPQDLRR